MNEIVLKQNLADNIAKITVNAPMIANKLMPGEFVVVMVDELGERIPLTVYSCDKARGTISLIFQKVGKSTRQLARLRKGQRIKSILGPLGKPTEIKKLGRIITIGGGVGIAEVHPVAKAFKRAANVIISIIGAKSKSCLILEQQMRQISDQLHICTDDGSYGHKGFVTDLLAELLARKKVELVYAVGPVSMMRKVAEQTKRHKIMTLVSLNPIMVDATGMCGSCRVQINREMKFACVDGPEFDAHSVDFDELEKRAQLFWSAEQQALQIFQNQHN